MATTMKGAWTMEEDRILVKLVLRHGAKNWPTLSKSIEGRSGKSLRLRWLNHLSPKVNRNPFSPEEDQIIIRTHARLGNKWATIAKMLLNGRTDNCVKNYWHFSLKKRLPPIVDQPQEQENDRPEERPTLSANLPGGSDTDPSTSLTLALIRTVDREPTAAAAAVGDHI
ncbi:transcription factor MYB77-like [Impatiens glandulifera]|uniref:transcription factor MYB77-like n=1 Tax=Impatiens glandulifera TaxID=253017 RepID=UPI001FB09993|nr:transcription factor MYB77-like [Impatiens glandulifera]